ncbi:hemicentin-1-like [Montipora foliosa]|uniref:hemicentin-1-like n=1 Tax=Montipora foliosa TaxID=591990 RepID=UPI0035F1C12B
MVPNTTKPKQLLVGTTQKFHRADKDNMDLYLNNIKLGSFDECYSWTAWGSCSRTCGGGVQKRQKHCNYRPPIESSRTCNENKCPIDGGWSDWNHWSLCTRDINGMQMRTRECVNPKPQFGGIPCKGSTTVMRGCTNTSSCQQEFPVRFQAEGNPSTGLMQIHKNNTWKALCTAHWNNSERILACHVNGYSDYNNDNFTGNWKRGNTSLVNITSHSCSSITQSCGLINKKIGCPVPVRLIGAKVEYGGRVEVFFRRRWGKICRNKWDINDVKVVCKQLGFRGVLAEFMTGMNTTEKNIPVVMSDIACTGQESVLAQCNRLDGEHKCPEDIGAQALCVPNNVEVLERKSISSNLGSTDTVKCSLKKENKNEREMVKWYEIGTTIREIKSEGRIEVNGVTLTIKNVQLHDGGTYECRGVGYTRFYTVYVNAQFKNKRPQQKLIYGKPGKISCTAEGNPRPQFEWSKNNSLLLEDDRFTQLSDGSLQIDTVGREDNGAYKCSIKQTKGSERITVYFQDISVSVIVPPNVLLPGTTHYALEGDNVTLTCTVVDGLPKPQISWLKDKIPLAEEKARLVKRYITEEGEGTYTCVGKNEGGSANDSIDIIVDAPPKLDASLKKDSMPVLLHSTLQLKCIERGDPEPNVTWTDNGTQLSNNNTFVITNMTFKDAGQYGCLAMNRAGNIKGNIWIDVVVYPVVDVYPRNQTVPEGKTTNISCKAKGDPLPKLSWKFDEGELPPTAVIMNTSEGSLLQLPNTTKRMEGTYKCKATNKAGEEHSTSTLHVLEKPTVVISGESCQTRMEGDKLNLTCLARDPTSEIRWTIKTVSRGKMANIIKNGDRSILIIERVKVSDSGEYMCDANNAAGFASSSVNVEVRVYPVVDVYPRNQTVPKGKTTNISCKAKGVPLPKLSWKFDEGELPPTAVIMNTSEGSLLQLPNITKWMEGRYQCKATNKAGEEHSTSTLHVLEKPTVVISGEPYQRKLEGDKLTLTCKTEDPTSQIRWTINTDFGGEKATITKNGDRSILIIEYVNVSDSGEYICEAKNAAGTAYSSVDVEVRALQVYVQAEQPPVLTSGESYQRKLEGDKLILTCKTKNPTSQIRWKIKTDSRGKMANITRTEDMSILIIESVKVSDSGEYICEAKNAGGTASSSVDVEVRALQVHVQAAFEWYYIVSPVSAVAVTAFIAWYLCKRRTSKCKSLHTYIFILNS